MVDLPFAFVLNAPLSAVTVCVVSSRFAIDTDAPGFTVIEANLNPLIAIVGDAVAVAPTAGGGASSPGPNKSAPAVNKPAPTHTTREPVMRFMNGDTGDRSVRFANRSITRGVSPDMIRIPHTYASSEGAVIELPAAERSGTAALINCALAGGAVALALGVYGRVHQPTHRAIVDLGFPSLLAMKSWLTAVATALAIFQLLSALRMYGRVQPGRPFASWLPVAHRWSGTAAFVISLPVAYHCLWSLGFATDRGARPIVHGLLGCAFYGAMATKLLSLRATRLPKWAIPVIGATLVTTLTGIFLSRHCGSSLPLTFLRCPAGDYAICRRVA